MNSSKTKNCNEDSSDEEYVVSEFSYVSTSSSNDHATVSIGGAQKMRQESFRMHFNAVAFGFSMKTRHQAQLQLMPRKPEQQQQQGMKRRAQVQLLSMQKREQRQQQRMKMQAHQVQLQSMPKPEQ